MDAIKKKMQAMKIEKDNALDRADAAEEKVRQMQEKLERVEEELRDTQKKMVQVENDCDKAQEDLAGANTSLEDKEKKLQESVGEGQAGCCGAAATAHHPATLFLPPASLCSPPLAAQSEQPAFPNSGRRQRSALARGPNHQLIIAICDSASSDVPSALQSLCYSQSAGRVLLAGFLRHQLNSLRASSTPIFAHFSVIAAILLRLFASLSKRPTPLPSYRFATVSSTVGQPPPSSSTTSPAPLPPVRLIRSLHSAVTVGPRLQVLQSLGIFPIACSVPRCFVSCYFVMSKVDKGGAQQTSLLDVLKKKMRQAREEAETAKDEADEVKRHLEEERKKREDAEAEVAALNRRIVLVEEDLERTEDRLKVATNKLEEASKAADEAERLLASAEGEVAALNRRTQLLDEELERAEERLKVATEKMEEASQNCDESERVRKVMENRSFQDEERANQVEGQLKEAQMLAEEADRKYDEVARKLAMVEADLERAEERAEAGENKIVELEEELRVVGNNLKSLELSEEKALEREETFEEQIRQLDTRLKEKWSANCAPLGLTLRRSSKIVELEEELRVVGNNLKSLEVSEEKALQREDSYEEQIRTLAARLKEAETRAEFAERSVQKLQKEVDRLEDDLLLEKEKVRNLTDEIEQTVQEIQGS
ncbi:hypothetical protein L596_007345 [Steinernema carpocapsae]|uniref:Tropomyosin n=1 Tax=Steinernema carpocapsae TaxID=34508 RepID=A0A4U5P9E7_STECR|nr:hypothetical protein L596_007345 [Steinernema carpocapsae]